MTSVARGFVYLCVAVAALSAFSIASVSSLWRLAGEAENEAARNAQMLKNRRAAQETLDAWRSYADRLSTGYISAASAAQSEAIFREEISRLISESGAQLSSTQARPRERGDTDGRLRLRVTFSLPEATLPDFLSRLAQRTPAMIVDKIELKPVAGIRRPGAAVDPEALYLDVALEISAQWRVGGARV
ncbi:MAG: type II secretion system protein GspM [Pseudomonadota bacterium]